jgi:DeoR family transcriptional regulator of aga operon
MTTYERRHSLLLTLQQQPGSRVPELAVVLGVSEGTIRNDLNAFEQQGLLTRVHGGAVLLSRT